METMRHIVLQEMNEEHYNRKHIDKKIRDEINSNPAMVEKLVQGVTLVQKYMNKTYNYTAKDGVERVLTSKIARIKQLEQLDIADLVMDCFIGVCYCQTPELFTSVTAKMSARLNFSDRTEAITTVAELLAVLCQTDTFDITKATKQASLMVESCIPLSASLLEFIENSEYLPPMVCEPLSLTHNHSSGYLTHNDSLILGQGNHHDGDICLDVLNTINKVVFQLDLDFLCKVEEDPSEITAEKIMEKALEKGKYVSEAQAVIRAKAAMDNWDAFKRQSYRFYSLMQQHDNRFYFTNKVDKRGRVYSCGYHLSPQGAPFKKAMLELAKEEIVGGVPT